MKNNKLVTTILFLSVFSSIAIANTESLCGSDVVKKSCSVTVPRSSMHPSKFALCETNDNNKPYALVLVYGNESRPVINSFPVLNEEEDYFSFRQYKNSFVLDDRAIL